MEPWLPDRIPTASASAGLQFVRLVLLPVLRGIWGRQRGELEQGQVGGGAAVLGAAPAVFGPAYGRRGRRGQLGGGGFGAGGPAVLAAAVAGHHERPPVVAAVQRARDAQQHHDQHRQQEAEPAQEVQQGAGGGGGRGLRLDRACSYDNQEGGRGGLNTHTRYPADKGVTFIHTSQSGYMNWH